MTVKERLAQIKEFFFNTVPTVPAAPAQEFEPEAEPAAPVPYKLADGTEVSIDKLEAGGVVLVDGAPAAEGEYALEDGTKITVGLNGVISEVVAAAPAEPEPAAQFASLEAFSELKSDYDAHKQAFTSLQQSFTQAQAVINKQESTITQLLQIVEQLAATPVANPVEQPKTSFQKQAADEKEERVVRMAAAWKQIREQQ